MKFSILLFIISISNSCLGQDTLREVNSVMYSRYYILKEDGQFEFYFNHCTGTTKSFGTYKMSNRKVTFEYSPIPDSMYTDSIELNFVNFQESGIMEMKRINNSDFSFTKTFFDKNQDKPWKKDKTRKIKFTYRID